MKIDAGDEYGAVTETSIPRNAPCPCGSGKKYKLCCLLADGGKPPSSAAEVAEKALRTKAFAKLVAFGDQPSFASGLRAAFDAFWSPSFARRTDGERAAAFEREEAESGAVTYFTLDAPAAGGTTVVEQFLAQPGKRLTPNEFDYLQRLSATRMGLFQVEEVRLNRGLSCTDLWSGERIDFRAKLLTHQVVAGDVIGARRFLAADAGWEIEGAVYFFTSAESHEVLGLLRAEWSTAHEREASLTEELFLKRDAAAIVNRFWFDHVFFTVAGGADEEALDDDDIDDHYCDFCNNDDDDDDRDDDDDERLSANRRGRFRTVPAAPTESNAHADDQLDIAFADPDIRELRNFLDSAVAPDAMPIDWLHGFLCAIACGPSTIVPSEWLPRVWGDTQPSFDSPAHADHITRSIVNLANAVEKAVHARTFVPLLPRSVRGDMANVAQGWCAGFEEEIRMDALGWEPLVRDTDLQRMLMPIWLLGSPGDFVEDDDSPDADAIAKSIEILPEMVHLIADYWKAASVRRPLARAKRVLARRRPSLAPHR